MKKMMLLLFACCVSLLQAQNALSYNDIASLTFLGVDFSKAKVYGAAETPYEFKVAFEGINELFISEPGKYNVYKYFKKSDVRVRLDLTKKRIAEMDLDNLKVLDRGFSFSQEEIENYIRTVDVGDATGYVAIILAEYLDKQANKGTYSILVFDVENRELIRNRRVITKARGFGLRNFWAGSVLAALKQAGK